jgi:hypothetical protein
MNAKFGLQIAKERGPGVARECYNDPSYHAHVAACVCVWGGGMHRHVHGHKHKVLLFCGVAWLIVTKGPKNWQF